MLGQEHSVAVAAAGASLIMTDVNSDGLTVARKRVENVVPNAKIHSFVMDVTSEASVMDVSKALTSRGVVVTALINNAAVNPKNDNSTSDNQISDGSRLENFNPLKFGEEVRVGLTGAILCSAIFGHLMAQNGGGSIINIASDLSVISPYQKLYEKNNVEPDLQPVKPVNYSVIKSGLHGLTLYMSTYWADQNVRSNTFSPGGVFNGHDDEFVSRLNKLVPLGRMANKSEYHDIIVFYVETALPI